MTMQTQTRTMDMEMDNTHLSRDELETLIHELSDADVIRLKGIAAIYTGNHTLNTDDLLHEAISRVLAGKRTTCPRDVPVITYIAGIIKSIANGEREKEKRVLHLEDDELDDIKNPTLSPEDNLIESEMFKGLEEIFEEDEEILLLILYLQEGLAPTEILIAEGWSQTRYNTIRRRMRRKWNTHTSQENQS